MLRKNGEDFCFSRLIWPEVKHPIEAASMEKTSTTPLGTKWAAFRASSQPKKSITGTGAGATFGATLHPNLVQASATRCSVDYWYNCQDQKWLCI
jgi:hypothetical protein